MKWCAVHKGYCEDTKICIAGVVRLGGETAYAFNSPSKADPTDFIIEKSIVMQPSWHNSRINYRLKRWMSDIKRYEFEGDFFWLGNAHSVLRNKFGVEKPETIPIVDLTDS